MSGRINTWMTNLLVVFNASNRFYFSKQHKFTMNLPSNTQLHNMLQMQQNINATVNPDWINAKYAWHRAIMVEAVEALEHFGWKWWKKQQPDMDQAKMELVDIWHFMLSRFIEKHGSVSFALADEMLGDITIIHNSIESVSKFTPSVQEKLDRMIGASARNEIYLLSKDMGFVFVALMRDFDMTWDDLYGMYVAKNVLNKFRQDNGYKTGEYRKIWGTQENNFLEDNEYVSTYLKSNRNASEHELYSYMGEVYTAIKA